MSTMSTMSIPFNHTAEIAALRRSYKYRRAARLRRHGNKLAFYGFVQEEVYWQTTPLGKQMNKSASDSHGIAYSEFFAEMIEFCKFVQLAKKVNNNFQRRG